MPNTAKTSGNDAIKTFINTTRKKPILDFLTDFAAILRIEDEASHDAAIALGGELMDLIQDDPNHPLNALLDLLYNAIQAHEAKIYPPLQVSPAETLRVLMEEHDLKQTDLAAEIGGQGLVSQILNGKRELNKRQIEALSKRFRVSPAVFFE